MPRFNLNWLFIVIIAGLAYILYQGQGEGSGSMDKEVTYTDFKQYVRDG